MGLEKAVEKRHIVETETNRNLFDGHRSDLELRLCVHEERVRDEVARSAPLTALIEAQRCGMVIRMASAY